jgi:hypothetical protein
MARQAPGRWSPLPAPPYLEIPVRYGGRDLERGSIVAAMEALLPLEGAPLALDLPPAILEAARTADDEHADGRPIALVRPVTVRGEWFNPARNPLPRYVAEIAGALMATHHVVLVADLAPGAEILIGPVPPHHEAHLHGELDLVALLALAARADVLVGGVGWIVPASIAAGVRAFVILGGHGGHNAPAKITDPRLDLERLGFAVPDRFCSCVNMRCTRCDKTISDLARQFQQFARQTGLNLPSSHATDSPGCPKAASVSFPSRLASRPMTSNISSASPGKL